MLFIENAFELVYRYKYWKIKREAGSVAADFSHEKLAAVGSARYATVVSDFPIKVRHQGAKLELLRRASENNLSHELLEAALLSSPAHLRRLMNAGMKFHLALGINVDGINLPNMRKNIKLAFSAAKATTKWEEDDLKDLTKYPGNYGVRPVRASVPKS